MAPEWHLTSCEVVYPTKDPVRPRAFMWQDARLRIVDIGRCWEGDDGYHRLVRVQDGRTFELLEQHGRWQARLLSSPPPVI